MSSLAPPAGAPLVLVGAMGSGKSTVGRLVADALGRGFVDLDEEIAAGAGATIPEIFATEGEAGFRRRESAALAHVLAPRPGGDAPGPVVATGGGVVISPANRQALREASFVVWLRAVPSVLVARVGDGEGRPMLGDDPAGSLERLLAERVGWYHEVAHGIVDTDDLTPAEVAAAVCTATRTATRRNR